MWLRDSGRKAAYTKALRAIFATEGEEMMMDRPRGIYEDSLTIGKRTSVTGDIWGGSILLNDRIELLTMVLILCRDY
jgi:hypothetical protein